MERDRFLGYVGCRRDGCIEGGRWLGRGLNSGYGYSGNRRGMGVDRGRCCGNSG